MLLEELRTIFDRPEKVKKLREYILNLAVRGKLVKQDENDEPASVLLERIREEKDRLVKEKKIKKEKPLPEVTDDEIPYELPKCWEWVRLGNLGITQTGTTPSTKNPEYFGGDIPFIKPADISDNGIIYNNESLTELGLEKGRLIESNSVLMVCIGGSIGKNYFTDRDCSCNQQINAITGLCGIDNKYVHYFVSSNEFYEQIISTATGSATPIINKSKWEQLLVQLPPLNEQKRIVEKVDYLMEFCDKLEEQLEKQVKYATLSAKSVLNGVSNCSSYDELEEVLRFIIENFKDLTLADGAIGELKNAILSLAVKGKLVPQDDSDEPASMLLERIKEEKDRLVKEKKIKKEKALPKISEDEIPYELPNGWEWVRFSQVLDVRDGTHDTPKYVEKGIPLITSKNINGKDIDFSNVKYISKEDHEEISKRSQVDDGDILFAMIGSIGNPVIVKKHRDFSIKNVALFKYYNNDVVLNTYLYYYLLLHQSYMKEKASGAVQSFVSLKFLRTYEFALPPLNEQKRIVEKVDRLMKVCDELELRIEESKKYSEKLMESILKESLKA